MYMVFHIKLFDENEMNRDDDEEVCVHVYMR